MRLFQCIHEPTFFFCGCIRVSVAVFAWMGVFMRTTAFGALIRLVLPRPDKRGARDGWIPRRGREYWFSTARSPWRSAFHGILHFVGVKRGLPSWCRCLWPCLSVVASGSLPCSSLSLFRLRLTRRVCSAIVASAASAVSRVRSCARRLLKLQALRWRDGVCLTRVSGASFNGKEPNTRLNPNGAVEQYRRPF